MIVQTNSPSTPRYGPWGSLNNDGVLLTYKEFLNTFKIPVRPKEFAVAIPQKVLTLLKSASKEKDLNFGQIKS